LHRIYFTLFCLVFTGICGVFLTNNGFLLLNAFEADGLHVASAVLRMLDGEVQHVDYHTPLGILAFLPTKLLMDAGYGFGRAAAYSNLLIALCFLPALLWVGLTRFRGITRYGYAVATLILFLALNLGVLRYDGVDIALYYNRWCWGVSGLIFAMVILEGPDRRAAHVLDGILIGLCLSFLALTKVTFFVFLAPPVLAGMIVFQRYAALSVSVVTGVTVLAAIYLGTGGPEFMLAYIADLKSVSQAGARTVPSLGLTGVIVAPEFLVANVALIAAGVSLRRAGFLREGFFLLLLVPGICLVVVQNWGNFTQWSLALGMILFAIALQDRTGRRTGAIQVSALLICAVALPQAVSMGVSLFNHWSAQPAKYVTVLTDPRFSDLKFARARQAVTTVLTERKLGYEEQYLGTFKLSGGGTFRGEALPNCELRSALPSHLRAIADDLAARDDTRGKRILSAATSSNYWMFGGTQRLRGGAIWYYGGDDGFDDADFLVIPLCTYGTQGRNSRQIVLDLIEADDRYDFTEVDRNDLYILLRRDR
jgi:hypothetical protein